MIKVYHWQAKSDQSARDGFFEFNSTRCLNIYGGTDPQFRYVLVAEVDTDELDYAYERTNHIDKPWQENAHVTCIEVSRSTSVNDLLVYDVGDEVRKFQVVGVGFRRV